MRRPRLIGAVVAALLAGVAGYALFVRHDAGDRRGNSLEARIRAGAWITTGDASIRNGSSHFSLRIESVHPIAGPGLEVTGAHVYLYPKRLPHLSLGTVAGWPPHDTSTDRGYLAYLRVIPTLPGTVTIPPGREAQIIVGLRSLARPGTTVRLNGFRVDFRRHWMEYRGKVGEFVILHTIAAR